MASFELCVWKRVERKKNKGMEAYGNGSKGWESMVMVVLLGREW